MAGHRWCAYNSHNISHTLFIEYSPIFIINLSSWMQADLHSAKPADNHQLQLFSIPHQCTATLRSIQSSNQRTKTIFQLSFCTRRVRLKKIGNSNPRVVLALCRLAQFILWKAILSYSYKFSCSVSIVEAMSFWSLTPFMRVGRLKPELEGSLCLWIFMIFVAVTFLFVTTSISFFLVLLPHRI